MRNEIEIISQAFYRTGAVDMEKAVALAELAVTLYEKEQHRERMRIVGQNPATKIQQDSWR